MSAPSTKDVSGLLRDWGDGDRAALDELMPLIYDELRLLARQHLRRERPGHTLQTTALVHEAYLRLADRTQVRWQNRAHFFGIAARLMRHILVEHARRRRAAKRGGDPLRLSLSKAVARFEDRGVDLSALDAALDVLARIDSQKSRIVELRFFGGLNVEETAEVLGISPATATRQWRTARAWLFKTLKGDECRPRDRL